MDLSQESLAPYKSILLFTALAYLGSYGITLALLLTGGSNSPLGGLLLAAMVLPATAALICRVCFREGFHDLRFQRFQTKYVLIALLTVPLFKLVFGLAFLLFSGHGIHLADWIRPAADGLIHPPERAELGLDPISPGALTAKVIDKLVLRFPILCLFVIGEEFGWRSFLQNRLSTRVGAKKAIVYTAIATALWHTGMQAIDSVGASGFYYLMGWFVVLPLIQFGYSLFFGWLYHRSNSLWPVVLAHAAMNKWGDAAFRFLRDTSGDGRIWVMNSSMIVLGSLVVWSLWKEDDYRSEAIPGTATIAPFSGARAD